MRISLFRRVSCGNYIGALSATDIASSRNNGDSVVIALFANSRQKEPCRIRHLHAGNNSTGLLHTAPTARHNHLYAQKPYFLCVSHTT